jgi:hypothetical protein
MGYRIKRPAGTTPSPELVTFDPDRWAPPGSDCDPWRATKAHAAWCAARAAWASTTLWPGKFDCETDEAIAGPDEPYDPGASIANGQPVARDELAESQDARREVAR